MGYYLWDLPVTYAKRLLQLPLGLRGEPERGMCSYFYIFHKIRLCSSTKMIPNKVLVLYECHSQRVEK